MKFLIDSNLSAKLPTWSGDAFAYVADLNPAWTDDDVWQHALSGGYVIITKDADFYHWAMTRNPAPKIVHFKVGNMRLYEWSQFIKEIWPAVLESLADRSIVQVYADRMELWR